MNGDFFPHYVRTADEAVSFLLRWAEQMAGTVVSDIDPQRVTSADGRETIVVSPFLVRFAASGTTLTASMRFQLNIDRTLPH